ncbi:MAG: GNAT family N-acetyltransferase [Sphingomonadales bacterium]|nr:GNAT family N-acetyltransferase [Sphingomonadales bacterium]
MTQAVTIPFVVGSRRVFAASRKLATVSFTLADLLDGRATLPAGIEPGCEGLRVLSAPEAVIAGIRKQLPGYRIGGSQAFRRYYIDMRGSFDDYMGRFSGKTRSTLRRKRKRIAEMGGAEMGGNALDFEEFRSAADMDRFVAEAVPLSRKTYQARLLDAGLPEGEAAIAEMRALAGRDALRAYLLRIDGKAVSYLYLPIDGETVVYAHLGYDPEFAHLSPGTVLQLEALERLFAENRYRYFDFTEGEGAHKALFGTDFIEASSFFLLRPSLGNRLLLAALDGFNSGVATAKHLAESSGAMARVRRLVRR